MKKSTVLALVAAIAVIAVGSVASFYLLEQPKIREITLEMWDFGYNGPSGGPTIRMKAGETIRITLINKGAVDHEFMPIADKDEFLAKLREEVKKLQEKGLDAEEIEESLGHEELAHEHAVGEILMNNDKQEMEVVLLPGERATFLFSVDEPGIYSYLCTELEMTFPQTHADKGMYGKIVVEP